MRRAQSGAAALSGARFKLQPLNQKPAPTPTTAMTEPAGAQLQLMRLASLTPPMGAHAHSQGPDSAAEDLHFDIGNAGALKFIAAAGMPEAPPA